MRLTCPNCSAQYEVPSEVIPSEGRDVQCSNCGDTWFQHASPSDTELETPASPTTETVAAASFEEEVEAETVSSDDTSDVDAAAATPPQPRRDIDPAITQLLREEAERETALRAQVDAPLETQTEMGLAIAPAQPDETQDSDDNTRESSELSDTSTVAPQSETISPRRDSFPDIDTVNSSLAENTEYTDKTSTDHESPAITKRGGFTPGFTFALATVFIAIVVYANAPTLAELLPPFETGLRSYVAWVDTLRVWLDQQVGSLSDAMDKNKT